MTRTVDVQNNLWSFSTKPLDGSVEVGVRSGAEKEGRSQSYRGIARDRDHFDSLARAWVRAMDEAGVVVSLVLDWDNNAVLDLVTRFSPRFLGLVLVDPRAEDAVHTVEKLMATEKFVGVKLVSAGDKFSADGKGFQFDEPSLFPFYKYCEERGIPISFHTGTIYRSTSSPASTLVKYCHPLDLDVVARFFPKLPIIVGHVGRPLWEETLCLANCPNVWVDITWSQLPLVLFRRTIETALLGFGPDRVIFGSDSNLNEPNKAKMLIAEAIRIIKELGYGDALDRIFEGNARRIFKLGTQ